MKRKDFLITGAWGALAVAAGLFQAKCSSSSGPDDPGTQRTFTSTSADGHTHSIAITRSEIESAPIAGISRATSSAAGHTHIFAMTRAQLQDVMGGAAATVLTSTDSGHSHEFTITKWF
jgi:hypothetical protein